jgi:hypothetical protein
MIGSPKRDDISFVTDEKARLYLTRFRPRDPADLKKLYPSCEAEGLKLLR